MPSELPHLVQDTHLRMLPLTPHQPQLARKLGSLFSMHFPELPGRTKRCNIGHPISNQRNNPLCFLREYRGAATRVLRVLISAFSFASMRLASDSYADLQVPFRVYRDLVRLELRMH